MGGAHILLLFIIYDPLVPADLTRGYKSLMNLLAEQMISPMNQRTLHESRGISTAKSHERREKERKFYQTVSVAP